MPELPDITIYVERLAALLTDYRLNRLEVYNPFVVRSVEPSLDELLGTRVASARRIGKRVVLEFEGDRFVVIHLVIAGRLRWRPAGRPLRGKLVLVTFGFEHGTLHLTEAGSTRRASLHLVEGATALAQFERGGLEIERIDDATFVARLRSENHTLKRALTDPRLFSGIGNSYSDEILHRAQLSPLTLTSRLSDEEAERLVAATRAVLQEWTVRLRSEVGEGFPEEVTAFRPEMAVHGRFGLPCPVCGAPVQRIRYASNETNYCARCQTGGRLLADRAMSKLLGKDWPKMLED